MIDTDVDAFLEHHGIKGMHWGVRKAARGGVSRSTDRAAAKDAKEFARAKLFFGEGAGNRRKLIKATVEGKKKKDPNYAKAFDRHLGSQDLSKHASKARSERSRKDKGKAAKQTTGAVARRLTGEMGTKAAFVAIAAGGAAYLRSPRGQATLSKTMSAINNSKHRRAGARMVSDFLKNA